MRVASKHGCGLDKTSLFDDVVIIMPIKAIPSFPPHAQGPAPHRSNHELPVTALPQALRGGAANVSLFAAEILHRAEQRRGRDWYEDGNAPPQRQDPCLAGHQRSSEDRVKRRPTVLQFARWD